jgi:hypothetical protein
MPAVWASHHEDLVSDGGVAPPVCDPMGVPARGVVLARCNPPGSAVDAGRDTAARALWMPTVTQTQSATRVIEPSAGGCLRPLGAAAPAPDLALRVKQVRQRRRFEPDLRVATDPFGREGQDIAVQVGHERADGHFQLVGVVTLCHEDHEHGPQEACTALVHAVALLRVPFPGRKEVGFLQQGVEPAIRQMLG